MEHISNGWFFAGWISMMSTSITCFVFLYNQSQVQSARSDKLYEMFYDLLKENKG